jgi:anti-anti-sigma factor
MPESSVLFDANRGEIDVREIPGGVGVVVALRGDHDLSTKPRVVEALSRLRRESRAVIVIDLRQCSFVDSTIIALILAAGRGDTPKAPNVSVVLPNDASYVCRALSVIGLRDLLPVRLSVEAALAAGSQDCDAGAGHELPR